MSPDPLRGWFADIDEDRSTNHRHRWQPNIQINGAILPLPVWLETREHCEEFIRREIIGQGWIDGPIRYACPDCEVAPDRRCVNLSTNEVRITFHTDRMRFRFGGWPS